jgi:hypothetical protein
MGCYNSFHSYWTDVFTETLTLAQCANAASSYSVICKGPIGSSYNWVEKNPGMTVEICLQVCTSSGFRYAGIKMY